MRFWRPLVSSLGGGFEWIDQRFGARFHLLFSGPFQMNTTKVCYGNCFKTITCTCSNQLAPSSVWMEFYFPSKATSACPCGCLFFWFDLFVLFALFALFSLFSLSLCVCVAVSLSVADFLSSWALVTLGRAVVGHGSEFEST